MDSSSSDVVLAGARAGDPVALDRLIAAHRLGVYRCGLKVCPTTEDAEDAVQQALWAATRAIRSFRGTASSVASWLFTIVRRECHRTFERHRRGPVSLEGAGELPARVDDAREWSVAPGVVAAALADLDQVHREVIVLRDIQELSAPEAAARLGISVSALKSRLHRARASLHDHVIRRSVASRA